MLFWKLFTLLKCANSQRATSFDQMETLLKFEENLLEKLMRKLEEKTEKLAFLEGKVAKMQKERENHGSQQHLR